MDTGFLIVGVCAVVSIIIAIFLMTMILIREMRVIDARAEQRHNDFLTEMRASKSSRLSEAEREQARLEGVNSVLLRHTHTHESYEADD